MLKKLDYPFIKFIYILLIINFLSIDILFSQKASLADTTVDKLKVGAKVAPPFIITDKEDRLRGISIELWENIANELNMVYDIKLYQADQMNQMLKDIEEGNIDLCINPLTVTSERVKKFNFTQPFYSSRMAIAIQHESKSKVLQFMNNFFSLDFLKTISLLLLVILIFGSLLYLAERKNNKDHFRPGWRGVWDGFWWSAVTMTTVGYGDKAPQTPMVNWWT